MGSRADNTAVGSNLALGGCGLLKHTSAQFYTQDAADSVINTCHGNLTTTNLCKSIFVHLFPVLWHHQHIDTGVNCLRATLVGTTLNLPYTIPVTNNKTIKIHLLFKHICQQLLMTMQLLSIPTIKRGHHRLHIGFKRGYIALTMLIEEIL